MVDAVTAVVIALTGAVCGELDGDAESCRLSGALLAGEGGETIVEGVVLGLRGTVAITDLPSGSWPAICITTPLALAIDPHTSAAEAAASGRDWCIIPPIQPPFPTDPGQGSHYWSRRQRKGSMGPAPRSNWRRRSATSSRLQKIVASRPRLGVATYRFALERRTPMSPRFRGGPSGLRVVLHTTAFAQRCGRVSSSAEADP